MFFEQIRKIVLGVLKREIYLRSRFHCVFEYEY